MKLSQSISTSAARGAVEKWLLQVQEIMVMSLRDVIEQARDVRRGRAEGEREIGEGEGGRREGAERRREREGESKGDGERREREGDVGGKTEEGGR